MFSKNIRTATDVLNNYHSYSNGWMEMLVAWPHLSNIPWIYEDAVVSNGNESGHLLTSIEASEIRRTIAVMWALFGAKATAIIVPAGGYELMIHLRRMITDLVPTLQGDVREPVLGNLLQRMRYTTQCDVLESVIIRLSSVLDATVTDLSRLAYEG